MLGMAAKGNEFTLKNSSRSVSEHSELETTSSQVWHQ